MATKMITLPAQLDVSKITYGTPKNLDNGGKIIPVYLKGQPMIVQIPAMIAPYGISKWDNDKGVVKVHLEVSFGDYHNNPTLKTIYDKMTELDNKFVADALENSIAWLKTKYTKLDVVQVLYTRMVKFSKDKETGEISDKYPPTMKLQIPYKDGKYACEVYDQKCQRVNLEDVDTKRASVTAIVQCTGLWVAGMKFGITWKVIQMKVCPNNTKITGYSFIEDSDDEDDTETDNVTGKDANAKDANAKEDIDQEDNDEVDNSGADNSGADNSGDDDSDDN